MPELIRSLSQQEQLNFLLTNRIPRRLATRFMGWFSAIESTWLTRISLSVWPRFSDDLKLDEAAKSEFSSLHDCFTRQLLPGAGSIDPRPVILSKPLGRDCRGMWRHSGNHRIPGQRLPL